MAKTDKELKEAGYQNLGWMNGWDGKDPEIYTKCRMKKHILEYVSYSHRGYDNTLYCDECKYYAKYDSSD